MSKQKLLEEIGRLHVRAQRWKQAACRATLYGHEQDAVIKELQERLEEEMAKQPAERPNDLREAPEFQAAVQEAGAELRKLTEAATAKLGQQLAERDRNIHELAEHVRALEELVVRKDTALLAERDRVMLWAHVVAVHGACIGPGPATSLKDLTEYHDREHQGGNPGTIRGHSLDDRSYTLKDLGKCLSEAEPGDAQ